MRYPRWAQAFGWDLAALASSITIIVLGQVTPRRIVAVLASTFVVSTFVILVLRPSPRHHD